MPVEDEQVDAAEYEAFYAVKPSQAMTTLPPHAALTEHRKHEARRTVTLKRIKEGTSAADIYRAALQKGKLSSKMMVNLDPDADAASSGSNVNDNVAAAVNLVKSIPVVNSMLEIGDGQTSLELASKGYRSVVVLPEHLRNGWAEREDEYAISTLFATIWKDDEFTTKLQSVVDNAQMEFDVLILSNMSTIVGDSMPFEFEERLGGMFKLAKTIVIVGESGRTEQFDKYFGHWATTQSMVQSVCHSADMVACITSEQQAGLSRKTYKITYKSAIRVLSEATCKKAGLALRNLGITGPDHPAQLKNCRTLMNDPAAHVQAVLTWPKQKPEDKEFKVPLHRPTHMYGTIPPAFRLLTRGPWWGAPPHLPPHPPVCPRVGSKQPPHLC